MNDILRYSYRLEIHWKNKTISGQTIMDYDTVQACIRKFQLHPEVLEIRLHTYSTQTVLVREDVFSTLVGEKQ
jgi:hypothetical protein